jgi:Mn2+/Fe2+ NRAMP family transporter
MLLLINRPRLMGTFKNKPWQNAVAWTTALTVIVISFIWIVALVTGKAD